MKKTIRNKKTYRMLAAALALLLTLGCALGMTACAPKQNDARIKVVTTVFAPYDWTKSIVGNAPDVSVDMLVGNGVDLHSYQPSVKDIAQIAACDLFIYVGGESDAWVEDVLKNQADPNRIVIDLLEVLGSDAKCEEVTEGMQAHDHEEEHEHEHEEEHDHEHSYDEHVWLSVKNAKRFCQAILDALCTLDPDRTELYRQNHSNYQTALRDMDEELAALVAATARNTVLFADRFPFRYLLDDYGVHYYAAFVGCSAETEASFETIRFLAQKADELSLRVILKTESANHLIAETVRDNTATKDQSILTLNSLQSVTRADAEGGTTYLGLMAENLNVLRLALE